jgi:hypothetical protein
MMDDKPALPASDRSNPTQPGKLIVADCDDNRSIGRNNDDMRSLVSVRRDELERLVKAARCASLAHGMGVGLTSNEELEAALEPFAEVDHD